MEYPSLDKPIAGAFRFNTDSSQLEIYDGNQSTGVLATSPEQQTDGTRMVIGGGLNPGGGANHMSYVNVLYTLDNNSKILLRPNEKKNNFYFEELFGFGNEFENYDYERGCGNFGINKSFN